MPSATEFEKMTLAVLAHMNDRLPDGQKIPCDPQTKLFGDEGSLDSLGIVNFIVAIEEAVEDSFGKSISLTDEDFTKLFEDSSVTVRSFSDYVATRIKA